MAGCYFNPDTNQVKIINATGLFIWKCCEGTRTLQSIIDDLKDEFDQVPFEHVHQQVSEYIEDLVQSGFIGMIERLPG